MNEIVEKFNESNDDELRGKLYNQHNLYEYKFNNIRDFLWFRQGHIKYNIPLVPDSNGFSFDGDDVPYKISSTFEPNKLILYRKDGKPLKKEDEVPISFINTGISVATMEKEKNDPFFIGNYSTNNYLSDDGNYLVIEYKVEKLEKKPKSKEDYQEKQPEIKEKGLRKALKKIFGKSH